MRLISQEIPWFTTHNPFDGEAGVALYVSPAGDVNPRDIVYRNLRCLPLGSASVCFEFPAAGDGPLGLDAHVSLQKGPPPLLWNLPPEYLTSQLLVNMLPHKDGLELDSISGSQILTAIAGEPVATLHGVLLVISTTKLDGGGVRVWFRYLPAADDPPVTAFRIEDLADPVTITAVTVPAIVGHDYRVALLGLADATDYTFRIVGLSDTSETSLATFAVQGDGVGPDVELSLTAEEW